jgi:hypothetical protein
MYSSAKFLVDHIFLQNRDKKYKKKIEERGMCVTIPHGLPSVKGRHSIFIWVCQIGSLGPARNGILCVAGNMSPSKFDTQFVTS